MTEQMLPHQCCGRWFSGDVGGGGRVSFWEQDLALERYVIDVYRSPNSESSTFDFEDNGLLWIALSEDAWDAGLNARASHPGIPENQVITGLEASELTQGLEVADRVYRAVYEPTSSRSGTGKRPPWRAPGARTRGTSASSSIRIQPVRQ